MAFDIGSIALGIGGNIVNNAIQYYTQKNQQKQAQANTRKNMQEQQELEDESWYNRIANSTAALKAAGLSPALATGQTQGAAALTHSESMPQVSAPNGGADLVNAAMLNNSQVRLNEAAADKAKAEAEKVDIENKHSVNRDSALSTSARNMIVEMRDSTDNPYMRGFLDEFLDHNQEIDLGAFTAFSDLWFGLSQKERDRELDYLSKEFDKSVLRLQFENGAARQLADMPRAQRYQIYRNMALMDAQIGQLNAETSLTEDKRNAIKASVEKLGQETLSILHHDPAAMWNAGEISSLGVMLGYDSFKDFAHGAGMASGYAVGGAVGSKVAGQGVKGIGSAASSLGSGTLKTASKPKGMMPEVYADVVKRAEELSKGDPVKKAQYINMLVRHWHDKYEK